MSNTFKFALALVATLGAASTASAAFISADKFQDSGSRVELDIVNASAAGFVQITDRAGNIIGTHDVNAGANADLNISLDATQYQEVVAELFVNGSSSPVADFEVDFSRSDD